MVENEFIDIPFFSTYIAGLFVGGEMSKHGFLMIEENSKWTEESLKQIGEDLVSYMQQPESIWFKHFLSEKGLSTQKLEHMRSTYPAFDEYYKRAKEIQQAKIVDNSLWKKADGNFAKFLLTNTHDGWVDKTRQDVQVSHVDPFAGILDVTQESTLLPGKPAVKLIEGASEAE